MRGEREGRRKGERGKKEGGSERQGERVGGSGRERKEREENGCMHIHRDSVASYFYSGARHTCPTSTQPIHQL